MTELALRDTEIDIRIDCMGCRDRYARAGAESVHILELVYGAPPLSPPGISEKRRNRLELRRRILRELFGEDETVEKLPFRLEITDEAKEHAI